MLSYFADLEELQGHMAAGGVEGVAAVAFVRKAAVIEVAVAAGVVSAVEEMVGDLDVEEGAVAAAAEAVHAATGEKTWALKVAVEVFAEVVAAYILQDSTDPYDPCDQDPLVSQSYSSGEEVA